MQVTLLTQTTSPQTLLMLPSAECFRHICNICKTLHSNATLGPALRLSSRASAQSQEPSFSSILRKRQPSSRQFEALISVEPGHQVGKLPTSTAMLLELVLPARKPCGIRQARASSRPPGPTGMASRDIFANNSTVKGGVSAAAV